MATTYLDRFQPRAQRRSRKVDVQQHRTIFVSPRPAGVRVTEDSAPTFSAVFACMRIISEPIAGLPWHVFRHLPGGNKERQSANPVDFLLHQRPNPEMSAFTFRETLIAHALLWGNGFAEIERDTAGRPFWLWPITPDRVEVMRAWPALIEQEGLGVRAGDIVYRVDGSLGYTYIPAFDMFHLHGLGFDGLLGYSVVHLARRSIGLGIAMDENAGNFFGNGLRMSGIIKTPQGIRLKPEDRDTMRKEWAQLHTGRNAYQLGVLDGGAEFQQLSMNNDDAQFLECVSPDTLFTMEDGSRRAASRLAVGDLVMSWSDGRAVSGTVAAVGSIKKKESVRLTTARGRTLIASADHPVLARRSHRTPGGRARYDEEWIQIGDLQPGNNVRVALDPPPAPSPDHAIGTSDAYFLGALVGDGHIRAGHNCGWTSADAGVVAKMASVASDLGGSLRHTKGHGFEVRTGGLGRRGSRIRGLLNKSGQVGLHSHTKFVPELVIRSGQSAWAAFLSGLFDADGSVRALGGTQKPAAYFASSSHTLLDGCQHLLALMGVQSSIYKMWSGGRKSICGQECESRPSWGLYVMGVEPLRSLASILDLADAKKMNRLSAYANSPQSRYRSDNFDFDRVVSIERLGPQDTIGIEIGGVHTHVTSGLVTHNSRRFQISEISRWFLVPMHKLSELDRATHNNVEEQNREFVGNALLPWVIRLEQEADWKLFGGSMRASMLYTKLNQNALLRGNTQQRASFYKMMIDRGVFSINDVRELEDLDKIGPDGDKRFVPLNMTLLEKAGEEPEPAPAPPPPEEPEDDDEEGDGDDEPQNGQPQNRTRDGLVVMAREAWGRIMARETHRIEDARKRHPDGNGEFHAAMSRFYAQHRDYTADALRPVAEAVATIAEADAARLETVVTMYAGTHCDRRQTEETWQPDPAAFVDDLFNACTLQIGGKK